MRKNYIERHTERHYFFFNKRKMVKRFYSNDKERYFLFAKDEEKFVGEAGRVLSELINAMIRE